MKRRLLADIPIPKHWTKEMLKTLADSISAVKSKKNRERREPTQ